MSVAAALAGDGAIDVGHLELPGTPETPPAQSAVPGDSYHQQMDDLRRRLLLESVERHGRNLAEVARHLGMSRQAVSYLMKRLKIS